MSQLHNKDVLARLFPVPLGPVHEADLELTGAALDAATARAGDLLAEMFADGAHELLSSWERVLGISPPDEGSMTARRAACVTQLRATGGLSRAYFISLAEAMGYEIEIVEFSPFLAGLGMAGYPLYAQDAMYCWEVRVSGVDLPSFPFTAGDSAAGDQLLALEASDIETVFNRLKPAHTFVSFSYV